MWRGFLPVCSGLRVECHVLIRVYKLAEDGWHENLPVFVETSFLASVGQNERDQPGNMAINLASKGPAFWKPQCAY
jgi:hypothetical protein